MIEPLGFWRDLPHLVNEASFRPWLFRIATNKALEVLRRKSRVPMVSIEDKEVSDLLDAMQSSGFEEQVVTKMMVERALAKVSPRYRACILLKQDGYSHTEIAMILGCSKQSISKMLVRGTGQFTEADARLEEQVKLDLKRGPQQ